MRIVAGRFSVVNHPRGNPDPAGNELLITPCLAVSSQTKKKRLCTLYTSVHNPDTIGLELLDQAGFFVILGSTVMQWS